MRPGGPAVIRLSLRLLREASASARSQRVASAVTILMIAGMCAVVILTSGRTAGSARSVLASIDSAGSRTIVIRAEPEAGLDTTVLRRIGGLTGISWAVAFGPAADTSNAAFDGGTLVPFRLAYSDRFDRLSVPQQAARNAGRAWASANALEQLGMPDRAGAMTTDAGGSYAVVGQLSVPDYLSALEPLVVVPRPPSQRGDVSILMVTVTRQELIAPIADAVAPLLAVDDPTKVTVVTSENIATLRQLVQNQLGTFGHNLVITVFGVTAVLVSAILYGLVMLRRRDFGRRRALGASQAFIVGLLLTQVAALSAVGAVVGSITAAAVLFFGGDPLPGGDFFVAVGILATTAGVIAALLPAVAAARRDPVTELRVP